MKMSKQIYGEPSDRQLDNTYMKNMTRPIIIDGRRGILEYGPGGWGNVAIIARFGDVEIVKCERESADYSFQSEDEAPDKLETYDWERSDDRGTYYVFLSDALNQHSPRNRSN